MSWISASKRDIDIVSVITSSGIEVEQKGHNYIGLCPFHADKHPSFYIYIDSQQYHCFGCGAHGDVISFVQNFNKLSFGEALKHLGLKQGKITPTINRQIKKTKNRNQLIKHFREWEHQYCDYLGENIRKAHDILSKGISPEDLDLFAWLYHKLPIWDYQWSILNEGHDWEKLELYKYVMKIKDV